MKKIYIILLLATFAVTNYSCNNVDTFIFTGVITDSSTGLPISNAIVTLASSKIDGSTYSNTFSDIGSITTDASGKYSFEVEIEKNIEFKFTVEKDGYFKSVEEFANEGFVAKEEYVVSYELFPIAYIKVKIKNIAPYNVNDIMYWKFSYGYKEGYSCCDNTQRSMTGVADTTYVCKVNGGQKVAVNWNFNTLAGSGVTVDTLYSVSGDTINYSMIY